MNIILEPELEKFLLEKVESGQYQSIDEAINEGLRLLVQKDYITQGRFAALKEEIMLGIEASERGEVIDGATAMSQLKSLLEQQKIEAGE